MSLTLLDIVDQIKHTLGNAPDPRITGRDLANEAGRYMMSSHPWKWAMRRSAKLDFRAPITFTDQDWDESELELGTATAGTFADYTFREGDYVDITGGTGARVKRVAIASKTSDDKIKLRSTIADPAGDLNGVVDGEIVFDYFELPADFQATVAIEASDSLVREFEESTPGQLQLYRSNPIEVTTWFWWGIVSYAHGEDGTVVPQFEIWPAPREEELDMITIWYRATWAELTDDQDVCRIPLWMETYYKQLARIFARGYEEEDEETLWERLEEFEKSKFAYNTRRRDGSVQSRFGPIANGSLNMVMSPDNVRFARTPVQPPS